MSGDATNDVFSAWSKLATSAFNKKRTMTTKHPHISTSPFLSRRANSLTGLHGRTVKIPVQLIPLERARAQTSDNTLTKDDAFLTSVRSTARHSHFGNTFTTHSDKTEEFRPEISRPLNLEESLCCSYPSGLSYRISNSPYAPQADYNDGPPQDKNSKEPSPDCKEQESELEMTTNPGDVRTGIQNYVDKAFNTPDHPLGMLMNRIEMVYRLSYGGIAASKFLLPHAIAETHSMIQRIHGIVRCVN